MLTLEQNIRAVIETCFSESREDLQEIATQQIIGLIESNASNTLGTHWISCKDRLPEEKCKSYWVCTDYGYQHECRWTNVNPFWANLTTDWHWNIHDIPQYSKVVAWMPLPEAYKGEE